MADSNRPGSTPTRSARAAGRLDGRQLSCRRGRRRLFERLDVSVEAGTITWLRGTNGAGKTSLMRILAGLSAPEAGEVRWNDCPLHEAGVEAREDIVYVGHSNALKDDLTLRESLAFLGRLSGLDDAPARADAALARVALGDWRHATVRTLSQGQRRRGALARLALDDRPRAWILDEPYDALDQASIALLSALLVEHTGRGGSVLLTSHQPLALPGQREFDLETRRAP